jgi:hypothetical protein
MVGHISADIIAIFGIAAIITFIIPTSTHEIGAAIGGPKQTTKTKLIGTAQGISGGPTSSEAIAHLKVITHVHNNCQPKILCSTIRADQFNVQVFTFENNQYNSKTSFPGSEKGWTVDFFPGSASSPEGIQYDVKQKFVPPSIANVTYSPDCQGTIKGGDNRTTCTINNTLLRPLDENGYLNVITHVHNNCQPKILCSDIGADQTRVGVFTFENNQYNSKTSFPGSEKGWTVSFFIGDNPGGIQYEVKQLTVLGELPPLTSLTLPTYSYGCHGKIKTADNNYCLIDVSINSTTATTTTTNSTIRSNP